MDDVTVKGTFWSSRVVLAHALVVMHACKNARISIMEILRMQSASHKSSLVQILGT